MAESIRNNQIVDDAEVRQELETVMPVIASTLANAIGADNCTFFVYDPSNSRTIAAIRHGLSHVVFPEATSQDERSPQSVSIEAEILRTKRPVRRFTEDDFRRWPLQNDALRERAGRLSDLAVPLVWRNAVEGVAYLWRTGSTLAFTDAEIAVAEDLARVAAMAVVNARNYGHERAQRKQIDSLLNVASLASSALTVTEVLRNLAVEFRKAIGTDVCNLYVFDETGDHVLEGYNDGLNEVERWVFETGILYPVSSIPAEVQVKQLLKSVVVRDPDSELALDSELVEYNRKTNISEILITPIVYQGEVIGVVYGWFRDASMWFSEQAIATAQAIANQAGGVVSRARLYDEAQRHIQETDVLLRIGQTVLTRDSIEPVLHELASVLQHVIPHDYGYVVSFDATNQSSRILHPWGDLPEELNANSVDLMETPVGEALRSGELLEVRAGAPLTGHGEAGQPAQIGAGALIVPLMTEQETIGALCVGCYEPKVCKPREKRLISLVSQQIAAAIDRITTRDQLARRARRQTLLASVTNRLASSSDRERMLDDIAELLSSVLGCAAIVALSRWRYGDVYWAGLALHRLEHSNRLSTLLRTIDLDRYRDQLESLLFQRSSRCLTIDEYQHTAPEIAEGFRQCDIGELLLVPMRNAGRAPGVLMFLAEHGDHPFDDETVEVVGIIASRIADAIEREQMDRNQEALLRVSEELNRRTNLDRLYEKFTLELNQAVPYQEMFLGAYDEETGSLTPLIYSNPQRISAETVTEASEHGISGEAIRAGIPIMDNAAHLRGSSSYVNEREAVFYQRNGESAMVAPLLADGQVIGVLFVGRAGTDRFNQFDYDTFLLFAEMAASAVHRIRLAEQNQSIYRPSVEALAAAVDVRDPRTHQHSLNVAQYCRICAEELGLTGIEAEIVELAGLLHDIGKLGVPDTVLRTSGTLGDAERAMLKLHPERGACILAQHPALESLVPLVRHHHEHYDGRGYPEGLAGVRIPLGARIIRVAEAFDNAISVVGGDGTVTADALDQLTRYAGSLFDPEIVHAFVHAIRTGEVDYRGDRTGPRYVQNVLTRRGGYAVPGLLQVDD